MLIELCFIRRDVKAPSPRLRGEGWGEGLLRRRSRKKLEIAGYYGFGQSVLADCNDGVEHGWHVCNDVNVPEASDGPALCRHEFVADCVTPADYMLATIDLDNQTAFPTGKIGEVGTDWKLPNEFETVQSSVAQLRPKFRFGIIVHLPKAACAICCFRFWAAHLGVRWKKPLTLTLSPQAGRGDVREFADVTLPH